MPINKDSESRETLRLRPVGRVTPPESWEKWEENTRPIDVSNIYSIAKKARRNNQRQKLLMKLYSLRSESLQMKYQAPWFAPSYVWERRTRRIIEVLKNILKEN